jgi:hypothetical protein
LATTPALSPKPERTSSRRPGALAQHLQSLGFQVVTKAAVKSNFVRDEARFEAAASV